MTRKYNPSWEKRAASLAYVIAAAKQRLEAVGLTMQDISNRSARDFGPWLAFKWARSAEHDGYRMAIVARVEMSAPSPATSPSAQPDGPTPVFQATWRAEAWQGVSPSFHRVEGAAAVDQIVFTYGSDFGVRGAAVVDDTLFTYGSLERLVLALLRRAQDAFPELLENAGWDGFPDLPMLTGDVDHLVEVRAFYAKEVEPWTGPPVGCTEAEVQALEDRLGWRLPLAYKQYLRFMGNDRKGIFVGSDWFLESAHLNVIPSELANMEVAYTPVTDTLSFMSHQGYIHGWMDLPVVSDDPPVYFYTESSKANEGNVVTEYVRFTELLLAELSYMSYFTQRVRKVEGSVT
ncbi:SMI1/KNR4 family protein [Terriglobus sp.]|uniref:SMI1/KNR4 family protein n=1 Tax=Terriglobus sp. TaxID=1889013 RepID=UPI003B008C01